MEVYNHLSHVNNALNTMNTSIFKNFWRKLARYGLLVSSIITILFVILRNNQKRKWQKKYFFSNPGSKDSMFTHYNIIINSNAFSFVTSSVLQSNQIVIIKTYTLANFELVFEFLVLMIFPWPFFDIFIFEEYATANGIFILSRYLSDYLFLFLLIRIFYFYRCITLYSLYSDAFCQKLCHQIGADFGPGFIAKASMTMSPVKATILNFLIFTYIYATMIRIFERPLQTLRMIENISDGLYVDDYFDAFYLSVVTITTVGYGDRTCQSQLGRLTCCIAALHGALIISFVVVTGNNLLKLSNNEAKVAYNV